ncbi:MAG: mechanosensitive ion channel family protein [Desulfuromonadales bacterium]|nr:MAG: mechanosensitive ion channel family protein [Desulfuromonadales bacterium]
MCYQPIYHGVVRVSLCLTLALPLQSVAAEGPAPGAPATAHVESAQEVDIAPVVVDGMVLFGVRGFPAYTAETRAQAIADRIEAVAADPAFSRQSLRIEQDMGASLIMADKKRIMGVIDADASLERIDRHTLSKAYLQRIGDAIDDWRHDRDPDVLKRSALFTLGATLLLMLALWTGHRLFRRLRTWIESRFKPKVHDVNIKTFQVIRGEHIWRLLIGVLGLLWAVSVLVAVYLYLYNVLTLFPWTRGLANSLVSIMIDPLRTMGKGILKSIPKLVFLLVLYFFIRYVLKLVRLFFSSIADGTVVLPQFEADWALPTYRLVRLFLVAFALIIAYPYIPGSETAAFKGVSLFIGVLFSLGSSSLIGNLIAGYTMTYRRAFRKGDRIKIGEHLGDVEQIRLLVTHLRTPKNEEVIVPNSTVLNSEVINYSTMAHQQGLILHTTVGIGYETPWRQVEAILLEAAARTSGLLREPQPFVLQKALGDFCVTYEINTYCAEPQAMNRLYTELHRNILDLFNEYGVQIMTPAYEGDPEQPKVVPKEQWYAAPARQPEENA